MDSYVDDWILELTRGVGPQVNTFEQVSPNRMTDTCENITFLQLPFCAVIMLDIFK